MYNSSTNELALQSSSALFYLIQDLKEKISYIYKVICDLINVLAIIYGKKLYLSKKIDTLCMFFHWQFNKLSRTIKGLKKEKTYQMNTELLHFPTPFSLG